MAGRFGEGFMEAIGVKRIPAKGALLSRHCLSKPIYAPGRRGSSEPRTVAITQTSNNKEKAKQPLGPQQSKNLFPFGRFASRFFFVFLPNADKRANQGGGDKAKNDAGGRAEPHA